MRSGPAYRPMALFTVFLGANLVISYAPLATGTKLWLGTFGLALPWVWAFLYRDRSPSPVPMERMEPLPPLGPWAWAVLIGFSLFARFKDLTTLMVWPNFDESSYGFDAFHLIDGQSPRFLYGVSQAPPLYIWGLASFFKCFGVSLASLWSFPALVSFSAVPLAYLASRTFFSRSLSFLAACLTGLSFWPVFLGRFSLMTILILPAEYLAFWALGKFMKASSGKERDKWAWILGSFLGCGFYVHLHWPIVAAMVLIPMLAGGSRERSGIPWVQMARMSAVCCLWVLPLAVAALHSGYGGYLVHLWAFNDHFSWARQFQVWSSCLTSPFWGMDTRVHTYQPEWGGFLNPFLTSLFFLGTMEVARQLERPLYRWLAVCLAMGFLPGILTGDMEPFRLFPLFPILLMAVLLGLSTLMGPAGSGKNILLVSILFIPSMALDAHHLFGVYHRQWDDPGLWGSYTKSLGRYRAYGILEGWRKEKGPGLIFTDFVQGLPDQSLNVAVHDFNCVQDPQLDPSQARWAAVLANVNYRPFLQDRFPDGRSYGLHKDLAPADGGWMLFIFPLDQKRLKEIGPWVEAQRALAPFLDRTLCYVMGQSFAPGLEALASLQASFQGDRFLRSLYWEKRSDLETKQALMEMGTLGPASPALQDAIRSQQRAVAEGYPAAHLFKHLGVLGQMSRDRALAEGAFRRAVAAPLDITDSSRNLAILLSSKDREKKAP